MGTQDIKELRERTGAGVLDCKKALDENKGNVEAAIDWLRAKGIAKAAKKSGRIAAEGLVHAYIHGGGKIGVLVEVNTESDFATRTPDFQNLVKDIAMHIAANEPEYVSRDEIPPAAIEKEKEVQKARVIEEGKPAAMADKIVEGRMKAYYEQVCLLDQKFVKDDAKTVNDIVTEAVAKIGENIKVRRFVRFKMGEGLQRREEDFAAEVAKAAGH